MSYVDAVTVLAVLQYIWFGTLVSRARGKYGIRAPATTGHEGFERAYRVQMNTLELLVALLPGLYLWTRYWPAPAAAGLGLVYLVGRLLYGRAYVANPSRRSLGFTLSAAPVMVLLAGALIGALLGLRSA
jgi:uncharacterized MAPEG superfamily protein